MNIDITGMSQNTKTAYAIKFSTIIEYVTHRMLLKILHLLLHL